MGYFISAASKSMGYHQGFFNPLIRSTFDPATSVPGHPLVPLIGNINGFFSWDPDQPPREDHLAMRHGGKKKTLRREFPKNTSRETTVSLPA